MTISTKTTSSIRWSIKGWCSGSNVLKATSAAARVAASLGQGERPHRHTRRRSVFKGATSNLCGYELPAMRAITENKHHPQGELRQRWQRHRLRSKQFKHFFGHDTEPDTLRAENEGTGELRQTARCTSA